MNKKLLALAIAAGMSLPVAASADVKIFGTITAETGNVDVDTSGGMQDADTTVMGDGGSGAIFGGGNNALGLKGTEKLGNGLTAYFKINNSFSTFDGNTGSGAFNARDRFVGVKGDGWHVQFGRMNTLYKASSVAYDPFLTTGGQSRASGAMSGAHNSYGDNLAEIGFKSGAWSGGFQITWEDATGENDAVHTNGDRVDSGSWNANIKYAANNWEAGFAYLDMDYDSTTPGSSGDMDMWKVHGKYSMNGWTFMAQYEDADVSSSAIGGASRFDGASSNLGLSRWNTSAVAANIATDGGAADSYDSLHLAVTYKFSDATELQAKYANTDWEDVGGAGGYDIDGDHWGIGVKHSLSKRTSVYGNYTDNDYDRNGATADSDMDIWVVGLRHNF